MGIHIKKKELRYFRSSFFMGGRGILQVVVGTFVDVELFDFLDENIGCW